MKKTFIILVVAILVLIGLVFWGKKKTVLPEQSTTPGPTIAYACANNKTITASFTSGPVIPSKSPDQPPTPTGTVHVVLSDGRAMDLKQTISADGARYSNGDPSVQGGETFVFWSKGNGALVLENNQEKSYIGCVQVTNTNADVLTQVYSGPQGAFSIRLPQGYTPDAKYIYQMNPNTVIHGVKFTIPSAVSTGTNLASDTYVSVETIPNATSCTADKFLDGSNTIQTKTDNGVDYSVSSSMGAGAGNRYEETVYALTGSNPCVAVRYFVHYGAIQNYPAGAVKEFDKDSLINTFDQIRRSLVVNR